MIREDGTSTITVTELANGDKEGTESESGLSVSLIGSRLTVRIGESGFIIPAHLIGPLHDLLGRVM